VKAKLKTPAAIKRLTNVSGLNVVPNARVPNVNMLAAEINAMLLAPGSCTTLVRVRLISHQDRIDVAKATALSEITESAPVDSNAMKSMYGWPVGWKAAAAL
jgi:hypothetical protein